SRGDTSRWVDVDSDGKYDYHIDINNWNTTSANGVITMTYDRSMNTLTAEAKLLGVQPQSYVNGYPGIDVDRWPWNVQETSGLGLNFPYRVSDLTSGTISLTASFSVDLQSLNPDMNFNIAADAWIVDERHAFSPGSGLSTPYVEVMVWVFSQNLNPAGSRVGEETVSGRTWEVWRSIRNNNSAYIAFKPKEWDLTNGSISYDIAEVMRAVEKYAPFDISDYYLLDWEIGTEWGTKNSGGVAQFQWTISDYAVTQTSPTSTPTPTLTPTLTPMATSSPPSTMPTGWAIGAVTLVIVMTILALLYRRGNPKWPHNMKCNRRLLTINRF
ncbi:MAG: hypothetical protein QW385_09050, partial [Thermoproteota archaeon]